MDTNEVDICDSQVQFNDLSLGALNYTYKFGDGSISNEASPNYAYIKEGQFYPYQYVTNYWGCADSTFLQIFVNPFTVYIPNSFTPNKNQLNETLKPVVYFQSNYWDFKIYNRWGELLFETNDQTRGWDGTYKNEPCQIGEYVYELFYESCNVLDGRKVLRGTVNLIR